MGRVVITFLVRLRVTIIIAYKTIVKNLGLPFLLFLFTYLLLILLPCWFEIRKNRV
jgi:hypothetical protein